MKTQFKQLIFKITLSLFLMILFAISKKSIAQQWQQASGMRTRNVFFIQKFHDQYIAGTDSGFWHSLDQGESWVLKNSNFFSVSTSTNKEVKSLTMIDSFWVAANWDGVFKSRDAGTTWIKVNNNPAITSLAIDTNTYFLSIVGGGAIRTNNGGNTWSSVSAPIIYDMIMKDSVVYAASWGGLVASLDSGINWMFVNTDFIANDLIYFRDNVYYTLYDLVNHIHSLKALSTIDLTTANLTPYFGFTSFVSNFANKGLSSINDTIFFTTNDSIYVSYYDNTAMFAIDWQRMTKNGIPIHHQIGLADINTKNYLITLTEDTGYHQGKGVWYLDRATHPVSISKQISNERRSVYPNPTTNYITLSETFVNKKYILSNSLGQILEEKIVGVNPIISLQEYAPGAYFIKIENSNYKVLKN